MKKDLIDMSDDEFNTFVKENSTPMPLKAKRPRKKKNKSRIMKYLKDWKLITITVLTLSLIGTSWFALNERKHFNNLSKAGTELIDGYSDLINKNEEAKAAGRKLITKYNNLIADYESLDHKYKWMVGDRDNYKNSYNSIRNKAASFDEYFRLAKSYGSIELRFNYRANGITPYTVR